MIGRGIDEGGSGDRAPGAAAAPQHLVGAFRPGAAGRVRPAAQLSIVVTAHRCRQDRLHRRPALASTLVGAREQGRVADPITARSQRLVPRCWRRGVEIVLRSGNPCAQPPRAPISPDPGFLGAEQQRDALVGLDLQGQHVGRQRVDRGVAEQRETARPLNWISDLAGAPGSSSFSRCTQVRTTETARPSATKISPQTQRDEGLGHAVRAWPVGLAIAATASPRTVPAAYCARARRCRPQISRCRTAKDRLQRLEVFSVQQRRRAGEMGSSMRGQAQSWRRHGSAIMSRIAPVSPHRTRRGARPRRFRRR